MSAEQISVTTAGLLCCMQTSELAVETLAEPGTREWWTHQLDVIIRLGCYPAALAECTELLDALCHRKGLDTATPMETGAQIVALVERSLSTLGDPKGNPRIRAARLLLGLDPHSRGLPLKDRRERARREIVIRRSDGERPVALATWLRRYEPQLRTDLAWQLLHEP